MNSEQSNQYDFISNALGAFREILKGQDVCILLTHHTAKHEYESSQDKILGSTAFQGKVDTYMILEKKRGGEDIFTLTINGKVIDGEKSLLLHRKKDSAFHLVESKAKPLSETEKLIQLLNQSMSPLSPKQISAQLGKKPNIISQMLNRLMESKQIKRLGIGQYVSLDYEQRTQCYSPFNM